MGESLACARVTLWEVVSMVRDGKGTEIRMSIGDETGKSASLYISTMNHLSIVFNGNCIYWELR